MPPVHAEILYIWRWFVDICEVDTPTYTSINSWSQLTGIKPNTFELDVLKDLIKIRNKHD